MIQRTQNKTNPGMRPIVASVADTGREKRALRLIQRIKQAGLWLDFEEERAAALAQWRTARHESYSWLDYSTVREFSGILQRLLGTPANRADRLAQEFFCDTPESITFRLLKEYERWADEVESKEARR